MAGSKEVAAAVAAILAMAAAQTAGAQAAPAQDDTSEQEGGLTEVIVTATRRAERLQDVPESITAFDADAISMRGLQQMDDYARFVPGLTVSERQPAGTTVVFRGVASSGLQFGAVSSSGLYLDEQPITQSGRNPDPRLMDVERIEALRGPQGTLYGASSQSGTLRVITNKPDPAKFGAWAEAQLNSVSDGSNGYDVSAMLNAPIVPDKLALRLVGFSSKDAGFIDNVLAPSQGETFDNSDVAGEDVNSIETTGGRAALRWDINENVNTTLGVTFQHVTADGHGDMNSDVGDLNQVRFERETLDDKWTQVGLTLNAATSIGDAVISATYFDRDFNYEADATDYEFQFNSNATYDSPTYDFGGDPRGFATNHEKTRITTLEARLASKADSTSRWGWLVGAFYSAEEGDTAFDSNVRGYGDTRSFATFNQAQLDAGGEALVPTDTWFSGRYDTELDQIAVFGELSFDVAENFTVTAGGRWFDYDRKFAQTQRQPPGFLGDTALDGNQQTSEDGTVFKLNGTYKIDRDKMLYATWSEGFRVGGSNPLKPNSLLPRDYSSDTLTNYEVGAKTEWLDRRLRVNISAYYMDWQDFAVQIEDPQEEVFQLAFVNLPSAEITGIEADMAMTITPQLQLEATLSYNDAKTAEASSLSVTDDAGDTFTFVVAKGARLPLTPEWNGSIGLEYHSNAQVLNAQPFVRFDYSYVGSSFNSLEGIESVVRFTPVELQDSYQILDLRVGLETEDWSGSLYVDNLTDERADLFRNNRWGVQRQSVNRPRTIGIQLRYNF
jgi:iron complex outermembrane receptor protein